MEENKEYIEDITEEEREYSKKEQKWLALFKARTIISQIGTMPERRVCGKQLKLMKKRPLSK